MSNNLDFNPASKSSHGWRPEVRDDRWRRLVSWNSYDRSWWWFYGYHWKGAKNADAPVTLNYKFTLGDWSGTHEDGLTGPGIVGGNRQVIVNSDTTIHWVWYNNNLHLLSQSLVSSSLTFRTNIGQAIANNGWKDGDVLFKWGYGGEQHKFTLTPYCWGRR